MIDLLGIFGYYDIPIRVKRQQNIYREQEKKCKSCKHFFKHKDFCSCEIFAIHIKPDRIARKKYERRKKCKK